ncbi:MAG: hypothetical protein FWB91_06595 [Defluviitaleaceae bacterium]|nr:hypothetical protein [Defluviitaleaceae bacterium]
MANLQPLSELSLERLELLYALTLRNGEEEKIRKSITDNHPPADESLDIVEGILEKYPGLRERGDITGERLLIAHEFYKLGVKKGLVTYSRIVERAIREVPA